MKFQVMVEKKYLIHLFMCYYNKDSIIGGNSNINNNDSIIKDIENLANANVKRYSLI